MVRGLFDPELEPGDRWKWGLLAVVVFAVGGVLSTRALRPFVYLVEGAIGLVLLVLVVAALLRLLR